MIISEKTEIAIIMITGVAVYFVSSALPSEMKIGRFLLNVSALLLFQSLVRDIWILFKSRNTDKQTPQKEVQCMCVESTVGVVGILIGAILLGFGLDQRITLTSWTWSVLVVVVLGVGFFIKDFVFEWNPWRIYRDKDHVNIVFAWKHSDQNK